MHVDHLEHRLTVELIAGEGAGRSGDLGRSDVGFSTHQGGDRRGVRSARIGVVCQAARHQERAEVGVAQTERSELVAVLLDRLGGVRRVADQDLLGQDGRPDRMPEVIDREVTLGCVEPEQVDAGQVAGRIVEEHVLRARIRGVDTRRVLTCVPAVDRGVELHPGITADPGRLRDLRHQFRRLVGLDDGAVGPGTRVPQATGLHGPHELVGHADRVVRVLEEDRGVCLTVERAVVAGIDQRPRLLFFVGLAVDELGDVGMIDVEDHHLGGPSGLAARLDDTCERVIAAHERDRPGGGATAGQ